MRSHIVLLTATIAPKANQPDLVMLNPLERLNDYKKALTFYQGLLDAKVLDGLVFAENSGYDLAPLKQLFPSPRIEWLSSYDLDYPTTYHRGYGEFRLIDRAMANSSLVAGMTADSLVWKVTGRYVIENLARVIRFAPKDLDLYCRLDDQWVEMSLMAWTRAGHTKLLKDAWEQFATGMPPELILASSLVERRKLDDRIVGNFSWPPLIVGRRGTDGGQFSSWRTRWKFKVLLLPRLLRLAFT